MRWWNSTNSVFIQLNTNYVLILIIVGTAIFLKESYAHGNQELIFQRVVRVVTDVAYVCFTNAQLGRILFYICVLQTRGAGYIDSDPPSGPPVHCVSLQAAPWLEGWIRILDDISVSCVIPGTSYIVWHKSVLNKLKRQRSLHEWQNLVLNVMNETLIANSLFISYVHVSFVLLYPLFGFF